MAEHTPGPWYTEGAGIKSIAMPMVELKGGRRVSFRVACCKDGDLETVKANARLIASAPTILEKAEALLAKIDNMTTEEFSHGRERKEREELRAAIARARGEG